MEVIKSTYYFRNGGLNKFSNLHYYLKYYLTESNL